MRYTLYTLLQAKSVVAQCAFVKATKIASLTTAPRLQCTLPSLFSRYSPHVRHRDTILLGEFVSSSGFSLVLCSLRFLFSLPMEQIAPGTIADNEKYAELLYGRISLAENQNCDEVDLSSVTRLEPRKWTESELEYLEAVNSFFTCASLSCKFRFKGAV